MIALAITFALILVSLGAWLRARALSRPDDEPIEHEPLHDDRWGGNW